MRRRKVLGSLIATATVAWVRPALAQRPAGPYRLGLLVNTTRDAIRGPLLQGFQTGLRDLGYEDGKNLVIEYGFSDGVGTRFPALATELLRRGVDCLVVVGPGGMQAAQQVTRTIPIVMLGSSTDPVSEGLIASFARPGGNITGLTYAVSQERFGKQLELLKEAVGELPRFALLWDGDDELYARTWAPALEHAANDLNLRFQGPIAVSQTRDLEPAFASMARQGVRGLMVVNTGPSFALRVQIAELGIEHGIAIMSAFSEFTRSGSLMSYGPDYFDMGRRGAHYVVKILRGVAPGDLPVEQPLKYDLVINLRTARALHLAVPATLLARADEVIE